MKNKINENLDLFFINRCVKATLSVNYMRANPNL